MIGIIGNPRKDGKTSFDTLIKYCAKDGRASYTGMQNIHFPESAADEMESLAFENPRCKDPLMHVILSWREMELPTNGQIDEAVKIALNRNFSYLRSICAMRYSQSIENPRFSQIFWVFFVYSAVFQPWPILTFCILDR